MTRRVSVTRPDESVVLIDGPWTHRTVRANGIALHVAEAGTGPLVLLLHGFPQFWWTWRRQLIDLADAGYRAVAVDLRGYGASDKPPRGYDAPTMAADIAALVTALGEPDAVVVGNDIGGTAGLDDGRPAPAGGAPDRVLGAAHPLRLRRPCSSAASGQRRAWRYALRTFQVPRRGERLFTRDARLPAAAVRRLVRARWRARPATATARRPVRRGDADPPGGVLRRWSSSAGWSARCPGRTAGPTPARCAPDHRPVLQLHGDSDRCVLPATAQGSSRYVFGRLRVAAARPASATSRTTRPRNGSPTS